MYEYFRICNYKERMFVLHVIINVTSVTTLAANFSLNCFIIIVLYLYHV